MSMMLRENQESSVASGCTMRSRRSWDLYQRNSTKDPKSAAIRAGEHSCWKSPTSGKLVAALWQQENEQEHPVCRCSQMHVNLAIGYFGLMWRRTVGLKPFADTCYSCRRLPRRRR